MLRPSPRPIGPGGKPVGNAHDEAALKRLGDRMAAQNGYKSQHGWQLYDTTGTTEDWSYNATGGYGYTFEIGGTSSTRRTRRSSTSTAASESTPVAATARRS